jgi:hypothetical protein
MHPILLAGAALVGLPILLHLILKQEPQRLPFPALRFLRQKKKVSQRKLRLKQILLLALRCLLVALFALALYQPRLTGSGLAGLADEQPVAAVLVIDTSPSMGYVTGGVTRLADARKRAGELLDELPAGSKVAVVDPADPAVQWEPTAGDARRRLDGLADPRGGGPPLTAGVTAAYQLLRTADEAGAEPLPMLVAIFTDRAAASWPADRATDLKTLLAQLPPPGVSQLVFDVGADQPADVAVLDLAVKPASGPAGQPVTLTASVQAVGQAVPRADVSLSVDDGPPERREVDLPLGPPVPVKFTLIDLQTGVHQAKVTVRDDALAADNVRFVTFKVGDARTLLTVSDNPDDAFLWKLAHEAKGEFAVEVKKPDEAGDFARYEFVTLLGVADPARPLADGKSLWEKLQPHLNLGGKLLVIPGGDGTVAKAYDRPFLPGKLVRVVDSERDGKPAGVPWLLDDAAERQPLLAPFREWRLANVDFIANPRLVRKYWEVEAPAEAVVVRYDDADKRPAVLEKELPGNGKVVLLTTRMDTEATADGWNNYWETAGSTWPTVWPHRLAVHLAGSTAEATFTFPTGQPVTVPLPKGGLPTGAKLTLEGPGVTAADATYPVADGQAEWRLPPALSLAAGSFRLRTEGWQDGFSLNPPSDEFDLAKVPAERVEEVTGPGSVVPVGKTVALRDVLDRRLAGELNLYPWLLIGVLLLFAGEGLLANRFYRG